MRAGYTGAVTEEAEYFIAEGTGISVDVRETDGVESNIFVNGFAKEGCNAYRGT